jgi:23S rRNA (guanosine2251-2'-O)-methyltransferase
MSPPRDGGGQRGGSGASGKRADAKVGRAKRGSDSSGRAKRGSAKRGSAKRGSAKRGSAKGGFASATGGRAGGGRAGGGGGPTDGARSAAGRPDRSAPRRTGGAGRGAGTDGLGGEQVEGRRAVRELLAAGRRPVREVWLADGVDPAPILDEIRQLADTVDVPLRIVNAARLRQVAATDAPQGVVAFAAPLPELTIDDLLEPGSGDAGAPFLVVVDGVTDPHNLGALLRTAECAGATGAIVPRHRSAHVTATVAKAAAGAIEYLPIAMVPGVPSALARLARAGIWTVGLDPDASASLWDLSVATEPIAVVLGAEGQGLSRLAKARCQLLVGIPQRGTISSLNVAAAGALTCFEVTRARLASGDN